MGFTKTEVNLRRLLAAAPHLQNQTKLIHYVATLREQLEQLAEGKTNEGLPRISKANLNEYSDKIEAITERLAGCEVDVEKHSLLDSMIESPTKGLRRRLMPPSVGEYLSRDTIKSDLTSPVKIDAGAHMHIRKHRKFKELIEEMVDIAGQLKQYLDKFMDVFTKQHNGICSAFLNVPLMRGNPFSNLLLLDSTEKAVEHSFANTGHANTRAGEVYSQSSKTSCFTWILIFAMTCIFIMVVLVIRVT